jgi:hypothetical protein
MDENLLKQLAQNNALLTEIVAKQNGMDQKTARREWSARLSALLFARKDLHPSCRVSPA